MADNGGIVLVDQLQAEDYGGFRKKFVGVIVRCLALLKPFWGSIPESAGWNLENVKTESNAHTMHIAEIMNVGCSR